MNEIFNFKGQEVRAVTIDNEPYFVGKDVADILGYSNSRKAIIDHVDEEDKLTSQIVTAGQNRNQVVINESGLYSLILSSKLSQAKEFKRWVTSEVLPTIRKNGMFATDELLDNPDFAIATLQKLKEERDAKKLLEAQIEADKPKVLFADAVSASQSSILVGELAKLIKQNGVDIGATRLFEWLRNQGYLIKRKGRDWNMPTQKSAELGLIRIKETSITHSDGHITVNKTPLVTGKGQQYFINKFLDQVS
ncbi:phage antirepressor [Streptococcus danieliae]|uniref:phage antirepressor n=1 Tax=Streptococcus danieliae TaxID=747656 RepID=UPI0021C5CC3E|nr:phage antirepressor KilAC domain-containing protein [Streptococcus danieliae]MCU0082236.1 phage antirepressor KilAC domain-containing protein [Streptococcus danieliae]